MTLYLLQRSDLKRLPMDEEIYFFLLVFAVVGAFVVFEMIRKAGDKE